MINLKIMQLRSVSPKAEHEGTRSQSQVRI